MEFDKSKILTVVTADQAKVGQKGWFDDTLIGLKKKVANSQPQRLIRVQSDVTCSAVFLGESGLAWGLFYPAPEPTYAERQAQWVKENNVKEGTKVRITRTFTANEDGCYCWAHDDLVGMTGVVSDYGIASHYLGVDMSDGSLIAIPYFALEVINEPTYEERQAEWIKKHNLKEGDKVKILRTAKGGEDGWNNSWTESMSRMVGRVFTYDRAYQSGINLSCGYNWPYFVLEVVTEPTYRPYNNDELNDLVGKIVVRTCDGNKMLVTGRSNPMKVRLGNDCTYTAQQLLELFTLDGKPCGIKEEA